MLESLIKCGATAEFGARADQLVKLDAIMSTAQQEQEARQAGQQSWMDFGDAQSFKTELTAIQRRAPTEAESRDQLSWEKELLGIYLSQHPLQDVAARMGDVVTAYLAELKEEEEQGLVIVACVVTSARKHITKEKKLMMFAQVEDLTGSVEATIFPRTYEQTAAVWNADEILLVLGRVEKRDDAPKLLVEHAVRFSESGATEIRRALEDTTQRLAKRAKFVRPGASGSAGAAPAGPAPRSRNEPTNGNGGPHTAAAPRSSSENVPAGQAGRPVELVIRFREALSYERSVEVFKRISDVLRDFSGASAVVIELPNPQGPVRRVSTPFKANVTAEVAEAVEREVGRDVVEVVVPGR